MEESDNLESEITSNTSFTKTINSLWILNGFSSITQNNKKFSPMFPSSEENNKWYVRVNLNEKNNDEFSIYLYPADTFDQKSVTVVCSFSVINSKNALVLSSEFGPHTLTKPFEGWGFYNFAKVSELRKSVESDKLKIQIIIKADFPWNYSCKTRYENKNPTDVLIHDFISMYSSGDLSDFIIKVEDEDIAVHKFILAARSPVFKAMLTNDVLEAKEGLVKITDFSKNTISALVNYMYRIKIDIENIEDAKQLFFAADKYCLLDLKELCENYLINNCNIDNIFDLLVFAEENDVVHLKKELMDYIAENKPFFKNLESIKLSDPRQTLMKDLISAVLCDLNDSCETQNENEISHDTLLINDFQSLLSCQDFSDLIIKVDDEEIAVHKVVLATRSPVFKAILKNDVQGLLEITDFSKNTVNALVKYSYTKKIDIKNNDDARQLLLAADNYDLPDLKQLSKSYLINNCNVENFFDSLLFAEENNVVDLKKGLMDYVTKNRLSLKHLKVSDSRQTFLKSLILAGLRE